MDTLGAGDGFTTTIIAGLSLGLHLTCIGCGDGLFVLQR